EHGAHLPRPRAREAQIALADAPRRPWEPVALAIDDDRLAPEKRPRRGAGLQWCRAGDRGDQDAAGLGLPPGIDDRTAFFADLFVVPHPGLGIDRLADRAENADRLAAGLLHIALALAHQRADRGRRGIEDRDLVLVADLPEARWVGVV